MDMSKYRGMFLSEAGEHLKSMGRLVIEIEKNPSHREGIDALFRNAHSIKGMAASMGYEATARLAHHLEDLMDGFRQSGTVPPPAVDRLLAGIDLLEGLLEDIEQERPERDVEFFLATPIESASVSPPSSPPPPSKPVAEEQEEAGVHQITVELTPEAAAPAARAALIFRELADLGELLERFPAPEEVAGGAPVRRLQARLKTAMDLASLKETVLSMPDVARVMVGPEEAREPSAAPRREEGSRTVRVRTELLDQFINFTGELLTNRYMLQTAVKEHRWRDVTEGLGHLARLITDLHHHVLKVRMLPLESITGRLPRLVRDLCRKTGKEVALHMEGEEIELDRAILEELGDPLVHMVRNAVDHGIERKGTVSVRAWREKDLVLLGVSDDGWGMDPDLIRQKAVEKGLLTSAQAKSLRDRDALQLICIPGFSTAPEVSETSGRGVGMDVVKTAVENLGGMLQIESERGKGTRILLKLPLSVAIIQVLLVECAGHLLGIPITRVLRTLDTPRREVRSSGKQLVIHFEEELVPLLSLHKILCLPSQARIGTLPVVVTEIRGRKVGMVVDRLVGQREAFVKTLTPPLDRLAGVSGATFLGDGSIVFIVDPQGLLDGSLFQAPARAAGNRT